MYYAKLGQILSMYLVYKQKGGKNLRKIVVNASEQEIKSFKKYAEKYKKELEERNVTLVYIESPNYQIDLYGYDGELKKSLYKEDLDTLIELIDSMPMGKFEKILRQKLSI